MLRKNECSGSLLPRCFFYKTRLQKLDYFLIFNNRTGFDFALMHQNRSGRS